MKLFAIALGLGLLAGLVGALCGVGGGIILVPAFTLILGMEQKAAVATSLAIIIISAGSGTLNHAINKSGLIDWRLVGLTAFGIALASWFGTDLMRSLSNQQLTRFFAILLILVGVRMLVKG